MENLYDSNTEFSAPDAKWLAQFIAFAPFVFQVSFCLRKFNILSILEQSSEGLSMSELCQNVQLSEYSLAVLLDAGVSSKILRSAIQGKTEKFQITQVGRFLLNDKITGVNLNFTKDVCYEGLQFLDESLEKNIPAGLKVFGQWKTIYEGLTQLPESVQKSWFDFDHFYSDESFPRALPFIFKSSPKKILDIGSNTGKFAIQCLQHDPAVQVTLIDHPAQLKVAQSRIETLDLGARAHYIPMDVLNHDVLFPESHDVIWMSQFLDCFSSKDIVQILKRCRQAMNSETELMIMETFTDRQKFQTSQFCLDMTSLYFTCMANGNSRMYRMSEFQELIKNAELKIAEETHYIRLSHSIIKCTR